MWLKYHANIRKITPSKADRNYFIKKIINSITFNHNYRNKALLNLIKSSLYLDIYNNFIEYGYGI
ncbi:hypothetical protein AAY42_05435 [Flagellimonas eckloniae]|uniref:Uncharacterized protein n=1 Tax=Flagellimonas eckloniae TaxID=346185 RepID=A0A0Q0XE12_9FLAO|nr:hypothetical protein AAY42_05435 [Allomuricauda eckloniae]